MELRLLHLSDIHFQHYHSNDQLDQDDDLRNEMEFDLERLYPNIGKIDAILVSGDVTFSANDYEYEKASIWLDKVCNIIGCEKENVLTVPGNHDIKRENVDKFLYSAHERFKTFEHSVQIDNELKEYLENTQTYSTLLVPLNNYYQFAQKYGALPRQNSLFWEKDFPLGDNAIRIRGLNSTIISNKYDNIHSSKMILGRHQTSLKREKGVIYLTLCHHPPQWLYDNDAVELDLNTRSRVQLFGHKHIFYATKINESLRISAGAVHPDKNELGWEPRYNILELSIVTLPTEKVLKVRLWKRIWNKLDKKFQADYLDSGVEYQVYDLKLDDIESKNITNITSTCKQDKSSSNPMSENIEVINTTVPNHMRRLVYMFLSLPYLQRIEVAFSLGVIEESDRNMSDIQKSQAYFTRASERDILDQLWDKVVSLIPDCKYRENPFINKKGARSC